MASMRIDGDGAARLRITIGLCDRRFTIAARLLVSPRLFEIHDITAMVESVSSITKLSYHLNFLEH